MTTWHECDVGALCDEAHLAHLRIVGAGSSCWGCGWCSIDGLSDGVVGVGRVVVVTGAGSELESVRVCPETVADGVHKLETRVCARVQTIDDPHIILHVALLGTTDAHSIADPSELFSRPNYVAHFLQRRLSITLRFPRFPVPRFPPLWFGAGFSSSAFSSLAFSATPIPSSQRMLSCFVFRASHTHSWWEQSFASAEKHWVN